MTHMTQPQMMSSGMHMEGVQAKKGNERKLTNKTVRYFPEHV